MDIDWSKSKEIIGEAMQLEAVKKDGGALQYFKRSWFKQIEKEMTLKEIEEKLGHKIKIIRG